MKFPVKSFVWEFLTLKACELLLEKVFSHSKISDCEVGLKMKVPFGN